MHVNDVAAASVSVMNLDIAQYCLATQSMFSHINVGTGMGGLIRKRAELLAQITGFDGWLAFDASRPDGILRKLLYVSRFRSHGWQSSIPREEGLGRTYAWFLENQGSCRVW